MVPIQCRNSIINDIKEYINNQGYVQILCDKYYIKGSLYYQQSHFFHELLISGYDDELSVFYFTDLNINRKLTGVHSVNMEDLQTAWQKTIYFMKDKKPEELYHLSFMQFDFPASAFYLRNENRRELPNLNHIFYALQYCKSRSLFQTNFCGLTSINRSGVDICKVYYHNLYQLLCRHQKRDILSENDHIVLISLKRLIENKAGIHYRMKYLMEKHLIDQDKSLLDNLLDITSYLENAFDCLVKYTYCHESIQLEEAMDIFRQSEEMDTKSLDQCLELVGKAVKKNLYGIKPQIVNANSERKLSDTKQKELLNNKWNFSLNTKLVKKIFQISHIHDISPEDLIFSILSLVLSRYTGQSISSFFSERLLSDS